MTIDEIFHVDIKGKKLKIVVFDIYYRIVKLYYNYDDFYKLMLKNKSMPGVNINTFQLMDTNKLFYCSTERWSYINSFDAARVRLAIMEYKHLKSKYLRYNKTELLEIHTEIKSKIK